MGTIMKDSSCKYSKIYDEDIESKYVPVGIDDSVLLEVEEEKSQTKPKGITKGRCLKFCLYTMAVLFGLTVAVGMITYAKVSTLVKRWTTEYPYAEEIPITNIPDEQLQVLLDEGKLYVDLILANQERSDFVVKESDINGFISKSDHLRGNMYISINPNEVTALQSLPMNYLPGGQGRFLVGKTTLSFDVEESIFRMKMVPLDNSNVDQPYIDVRLRLSFGHDHGITRIAILSGQFLDWTIPQDFIDRQIDILEIIKQKCAHHHKQHEGHSHLQKPIADSITNILSEFNGLELDKGQMVFHGNSRGELTNYGSD